MLTLSQGINDEGEDDASKEEHVALLEAREEAAASLQATQHPRAIAVRRVDSSRADAQGLTRLRRGGPTGAYPSATAQGRGWAPADARALSTAGGARGGPRRVSNWRPAGAAGAGPGERAQTSAGRSSAAPLGIVGGHPPRERPRD